MRRMYAVLLLVVLFLTFSIPAAAQSRRTEPAPSQIWGFGLVVGLKGTGDVKAAERTRKAVAELKAAKAPGLSANPEFYRAGNVAYVTVIADLPANYRPGDKLDARLAAFGDATDLRGGTLLPTPLRGPDDKVYAQAEGAITDDMVGLEGLDDGPLTRANLSAGAIVDQPTLVSGQAAETPAEAQETVKPAYEATASSKRPFLRQSGEERGRALARLGLAE